MLGIEDTEINTFWECGWAHEKDWEKKEEKEKKKEWRGSNTFWILYYALSVVLTTFPGMESWNCTTGMDFEAI